MYAVSRQALINWPVRSMTKHCATLVMCCHSFMYYCSLADFLWFQLLNQSSLVIVASDYIYGKQAKVSVIIANSCQHTHEQCMHVYLYLVCVYTESLF